MINKSSPRIEPWGTPYSMFDSADVDELKSVMVMSLMRKLGLTESQVMMMTWCSVRSPIYPALPRKSLWKT